MFAATTLAAIGWPARRDSGGHSHKVLQTASAGLGPARREPEPEWMGPAGALVPMARAG
jgi:hypothetical protein